VQPWLATGATNGVLIISDLSAFTVRLRLRLRGGVTALRFVPRSALLVAASANGFVTVFDVRDGSIKAEHTGHAGPVFDIVCAGAAAWTAGDDGVCRQFPLPAL
jgi:hypothetical protein